MSRIIFHRPARVLPPRLPTEPVILAAPPPPVGKGGSDWMYLMVPLTSGIIAAAYISIGGRKSLILAGIGLALVPVVAILGMRQRTRGNQRKAKLRGRDGYLEHLVEVRRATRQIADDQRVIAAWSHPSPYRLWAIATQRRRVWERRSSDPDFLHVCVGVGRAPLATPIRLATRYDPAREYDSRSEDAAHRLIASLSTVGSQPAVVDLAATGVVSVLGPSGVARGVVRAMLCQIGVLHAPDDVGVAIATGGEDWDWAKWLPHTHEPDRAGAAGVVPLVATDFDGVSDYLRTVLDAAAAASAGRRSPLSDGARPHPRRLVVVLDRYDPKAEWARAGLGAELLAAAGPGSGITVICVVGRESDEPARADVRVRVKQDGALTLEERGAQRRPPVADVVADWPEPGLCEAIARALAPLRLPVEGDGEETLARTVSLPDLLGLTGLESFDPGSRRVAAASEGVLRLPIGVDGNGQPVELDLRESAQGGMGPHGLIVGATGSGKSELLRTLVTGLAAKHSPELLSFVLVDLKGGATFADATELPHVAGLITNLGDDLALVDRMREALVGEQQRRQRLLRDAGNVDTVRDYQLLRAAGGTGPDGQPLEPLPYLLIIVDEFGELLTVRPDFTELLVQIGRAGGSLGMHLLLAGRRLEEGWLRDLESSLSYRICLRTLSAAESRIAIGTPDAHRLPPLPGSGYLKVADAEPERFRAAYVSGPYQPAARRAGASGPLPTGPVPFGLRVAPEPGTGTDVRRARRPRPTSSATARPAALRAIVDRLSTSDQPAHQVWIPPLPAGLSLDSLAGPIAIQPERGLAAERWPHRGELHFPVGVLDVPIRQLQYPLVPNFAQGQGHLALVGAPQSGKSTFLRTLLLSAMLTHTPDEAQFHCLDFGGGSLQTFERAPHVSGVAGRQDPQQARQVLADLLQLVAERERLLHHLRVDSVAEFRRRRTEKRLPQGLPAADVFLVIDDWAAARGELPDADAVLLDLANRGPGVAVHLILTANRWADVRTALRDSFSARLELRLDDPAESEINRGAARLLANAPAGRGLAPPGVQFQLALPRLDGIGNDQGLGDAQDEAVAKLAAAWQGVSAPPIRTLPERVTGDEPALPEGEPRPGVPIGLAQADLAPVHLELTRDDPHFLVLGDSGSGKSAFLRTWMTGLAAQRTAWEVRFIVVDYRGTLLGIVAPEYLGAYAGDAAAASEYVSQVAAKLAERLPPAGLTADQLRERSWWTGPEFYLVVDDYDLVGDGRQSPLAPLVEYLPQARELGLHVVLARQVTGLTRIGATDPLLSRVREQGVDGLVLSGDPHEGVILGDQRAAQRPPGRGVLVRRQFPTSLIQVAVSG